MENRAQNADLNVHQARLQRAIQSAQMNYWEIDLATGESFISGGMTALFGAVVQELTPFEVIQKFIHPEDSLRVRKVLNDALQNQHAYLDEYRIVRPDGSVRWILSRGDVTQIRNGRPTYLSGLVTDITERKAAEAKLAAVEEQLRSAVSVSRVGFYDWDMAQDRIKFSEIMQRDWGIPADAPLQDILDCIHAEDRDRTIALIGRAIKAREHYRTEYRVIRPDGKVIWIEAHGEVTYDQWAKPIRFFGTSIDVTARHRREQRHATERNKLKTIVRESPAAIGLMRGPNLIFEIANEKWLGLVSHRDYIGKSYAEVYPELVDSPAIRSIKETFATGESFTANEMKLLVTSPAGKLEEQYYDYTNIRVLDGDGNPFGVFCNALNVTDRVNARLLLEESEKNLRSMQTNLDFALESAKMGSWHIDLNTQRLTTSASAARIFGLSVINDNVFEFFAQRLHPDDRHKTNLAWTEAVANRTPYYSEYRIIRPDGQTVWAFSRGETRFDGEGEAVAISGVLGDITERTLARLALEENKQKLEKSVRELEDERDLRERFVAALSHDLRTPMAATKMSAQLLLRKRAEDPDFVRTIAERICRGMNRADKMIRDLLDATRIKAGQGVSLSLSKVELNTLVEKVVADLTLIHGPRFHILADPTPIEGLWDSEAVQRIIENLAGNAVKYGAEGKAIGIRLTSSDKFVEIAVHNDGPAIAHRDQEDLFAPYRRSESAKSGGQMGWGIGLTLVKGLAEAHRGAVRVESSPEQGTTFSIRLPRDGKMIHDG